MDYPVSDSRTPGQALLSGTRNTWRKSRSVESEKSTLDGGVAGFKAFDCAEASTVAGPRFGSVSGVDSFGKWREAAARRERRAPDLGRAG